MNFTNFVKSVRHTLAKHSPEILTGIGLAGVTATVITAVRVTPKAVDILNGEKEERLKSCKNADDAEAAGLVVKEKDGETVYKLPKKDVVKLTWRLYILPAATGMLSIACILGANSVHRRRSAAWATACTLSEAALREYKNKVIETLGEKKERVISDAVAKDHIAKTPIINKEIIITSKGDSLCFDSLSGRYFKSDIEKIRQVINELNRRMLSEMYISLNEFYYEIGLNETKLGNELGWHIDNGRIEISFSSQIAEDGTPCLVLDYNTVPKYDYRGL